MHILLIEDDEDVATNISEYLEQRGASLDFAYDGRQGLDLASDRRYDAVVLDLGLPHMDGIDVCKALRRQAASAPILMLTARDALEEKVEGFQAGADDYLVKPFALPELYHRLVALLRRAAGPSDARLVVGDLVIDPHTREVHRAGREIQLNRTELRILEVLARAAPRLVTRGELERAVWAGEEIAPDLLRSYVYRIRQRVDRPFASPLLHTVHGEGYRLRRD